MQRLFLIKLDARRDGRPSEFAVECQVDQECKTVTLIRAADCGHELSTEEVQELMEKRGLEKAILKAEWHRRTPAALRGDDEDDYAPRSRGRG
jgi:hypothetical protein